jgi:indole-3-glycerol phosphate synthase
VSGVPDILQRILARKRDEIDERSRRTPLAELRAVLDAAPAVRPFLAALRARIEVGDAAVIAEIKRASPSKGVLRAAFDPASIARSYEAAGATCLSVLTDHDFFQGHEAHLEDARTATRLPVLRKDFVIDAYQIYEARAMGADCILLIVAALEDAQMADLLAVTHELGMNALIEVHDDTELARAAGLDAALIGINNRDLRSFETRLDTTLRLMDRVPEGRLLVTESGILAPEDVTLMRGRGVHAFLVGEAFMRAPDPGAALRDLFG